MFSGGYILKICVFITVLMYYTRIANAESGEKKIKIKIGFDLTQGENGSPSLKIRDFEKDSPEVHLRTGQEPNGKPPKNPVVVRADSFSESGERSKEKTKERLDSSESKSKSREDSDMSSDEKRGVSTRGMGAGDYEPEIERNAKPRDLSKESSSSSGENSDGASPDSKARRHKSIARRKRNAPVIKALMEKIRNRSRELFAADRRHAEKATKI